MQWSISITISTKRVTYARKYILTDGLYISLIIELLLEIHYLKTQQEYVKAIDY